MVGGNLEGERTGCKLNVLLLPGVQTLNERHVIVSVGGIPSGTEQDSTATCNGVNVLGDGGYITLNFELHVLQIKGNGVFFTSAGELVAAVAVTLLLGRDPFASVNNLVGASGGAITILAVENIPVRIEILSKAEVNSAGYSSFESVNAITAIEHLNTLGGIPALTKRFVTYQVHCCIGVKANESNQHR